MADKVANRPDAGCFGTWDGTDFPISWDQSCKDCERSISSTDFLLGLPFCLCKLTLRVI
jgi:hypothetical protein